MNPKTNNRVLAPRDASLMSSGDGVIDSHVPRLKVTIFRCQKCEIGFPDKQMLEIHRLLDLRCVDSPAQARFQTDDGSIAPSVN